jgi:hypothetical protein
MRDATIEHQKVASGKFNGSIGQLQPETADEGVNDGLPVYPMFFRLCVLFHGNKQNATGWRIQQCFGASPCPSLPRLCKS